MNIVNKNSYFYISPNKLKIWLECPRKYWHYYINEPTKYLEPPRPYYTLGEAVHDTLNSFYSLVPQIRNKNRLFNMFEMHWRASCNREGGFKDREEEASYKNRAINMLENFYENEDTTITPFQLSPAKTKYVELTSKIMLGGKVDRVDLELDKSLHIIDYKTGKEDRDDPHQLFIYDLLVRSWLKKEVSKLSYLHLESGNWSTKVSTLGHRDNIKKLIIDTVNEIPTELSHNFYICKLGKSCHHCDYLKELRIEPVLS